MCSFCLFLVVDKFRTCFHVVTSLTRSTIDNQRKVLPKHSVVIFGLLYLLEKFKKSIVAMILPFLFGKCKYKVLYSNIFMNSDYAVSRMSSAV